MLVGLSLRFGFRYEPQLKISVIPCVGEQEVAISQLNKLIEDKIVEEVMVSECVIISVLCCSTLFSSCGSVYSGVVPTGFSLVVITANRLRIPPKTIELHTHTVTVASWYPSILFFSYWFGIQL